MYAYIFSICKANTKPIKIMPSRKICFVATSKTALDFKNLTLFENKFVSKIPNKIATISGEIKILKFKKIYDKNMQTKPIANRLSDDSLSFFI
ncbi:hypothetical protein LMG7974_01693 [Campylobacter majalis]|uniref:Uncharacterized protein n=1 Tax=Campylobacter majalis TaxID=2790656 RepID=A0ABM8Q9X1_9BACT|nr:hypothetical protein LMG7974_01693 [Campylobacter majalis]